jgi:uncharacterized protein (DUF4415 family)
METPANGNGSCRQRETILNHTIIIIDRVNTFRAGWQTRMNAALADWLKTHSPLDAEN